MRTFQHGDTVICLGRIADAFTDVLAVPGTSVKIDIFNPIGVKVVTAQNMTNDSPANTLDGINYNYHYDYNPASDAPNGKYTYKYYAIDGARNTELDGTFILE